MNSKAGLILITAPIKAADTIQKLFFEEHCAASNQEQLLYRKYFLKLSLIISRVPRYINFVTSFSPGADSDFENAKWFATNIKIILTTSMISLFYSPMGPRFLNIRLILK